MITPWGELDVFDAHVHFLSSNFYDTLGRQKGAPISADLSRLKIEAPAPDPEHLTHRWIDELDRHAVAGSVLIASVPGDEASVVKAAQFFPNRFHAYFMIDVTQPDAVDRVTLALDNGARGVCFFPAMHRYSMHDDRVSAILDRVGSRSGIVIFVHCGALSVGIRGKLGLQSRFDMRFSNPIDLHGVALRYPNLTFVLPHFGAGYFREALMLANLCPNVCFDTSSSNDWVRYQFPTLNIRDVFARALDVVGTQRLLFGTDSSFFPRGWVRRVFEAQADALNELGISAGDAALIFGGNLRRILGS